MEVITYIGEGFQVLKEFESWKIGYLRYNDRFSKFDQFERHMETDEVFVLLEGSATLYTDEESCEMVRHALYNIAKGVWHHIVVSEDATVLVVENSNTTKENTEKKWRSNHVDECVN